MKKIALKSAALATACTAAVFLSPLAAHANTAATSRTGAIHSAIKPASVTVDSEFTGLTYPGTSAGLSACGVQGAADITFPTGDVFTFSCQLDNPNEGVYNLWIYYFVKS
jgi:hypothetical protein